MKGFLINGIVLINHKYPSTPVSQTTPTSELKAVLGTLELVVLGGGYGTTMPSS